MNKREIRKYCKTFKHKLPYVPKEKNDLQTPSIRPLKLLLVEHPFATLEDIHREFGTVEELCEEYKDHLTPEQMTKSVRRTKLLCGLAGIIAIALFCSVYILYTKYELLLRKKIHIYTIIESETQEE